MVVHAFPIAKLGALLIKQISKPIANTVKHHAKSSPVFRKYVCLPPAQFYNWCEVKMKMWILNFGQPVNIPIMNEKMAIELGAELVGEGVIFIIAAALLINEYARSARKEAAKEEKKKEEWEQLQNTIRELFIQTEEQGAHIRELTRKVGDLETRMVLKPWSPKNKSPPDEPPPPKRPPFVPPIFDRGLPTPEQDQQNHEEEEEEEDTNNNKDSSRDAMKDFRYKSNFQESSLILRAIGEVEHDFWSSSDKREESILATALNFLYKDVYKVPLKF